jgi:hypothetical protein
MAKLPMVKVCVLIKLWVIVPNQSTLWIPSIGHFWKAFILAWSRYESFKKNSYKLCLDILGPRLIFCLLPCRSKYINMKLELVWGKFIHGIYLRSLPSWYWYKVGSALVHPGLVGSLIPLLIPVLGLYIGPIVEWRSEMVLAGDWFVFS